MCLRFALRGVTLDAILGWHCHGRLRVGLRVHASDPGFSLGENMLRKTCWGRDCCCFFFLHGVQTGKTSKILRCWCRYHMLRLGWIYLAYQHFGAKGAYFIQGWFKVCITETGKEKNIRTQYNKQKHYWPILGTNWSIPHLSTNGQHVIDGYMFKIYLHASFDHIKAAYASCLSHLADEISICVIQSLLMKSMFSAGSTFHLCEWNCPMFLGQMTHNGDSSGVSCKFWFLSQNCLVCSINPQLFLLLLSPPFRRLPSKFSFAIY